MAASRPAKSFAIACLTILSAIALTPTPPTLLGAMAAPQDQELATMIAGRPVSPLYGVWRSRGYGYVLRITADGLKLFHTAGAFCYADPRPRRDPDGIFAYYRSLENGTVAFSGTPGQTRYIFDRIPELPAACSDQTAWSPSRIAALVAAIFTDLYPSFAERGIDWRARTAELDRKLGAITSEAALFDALRALIAGVEDPHIELHATVAGAHRVLLPGQARTLMRVGAIPGAGPEAEAREEAWQNAYRRGVLDVVLKGKGHETANDHVLWGRMGDLGYLNILTMERFSTAKRRPADDTAALDAALDRAIAAFKDAPAVIVDVSNNDGGFDSLAQHVAGRFAAEPRPAYSKVAFGARGVEAQPFDVKPSARRRYLGPVYLLTSDITMSAAEVFVLLMRALPNVIHFGDTTRGALSDTMNKPLPNGWKLVLPPEIYRDPAGQNYEARGIPPQRPFEVFPPDDLFGGHAKRVLILADEIRREVKGGAAPP